MNDPTEVKTLRSHRIKEIRAYFLKKLIPSSNTPQLDTDILLQSILKKNRAFLLAYPEYELTQPEYDQLERDIQRRMQGEPIAYIIGETEFWSLPFKVNSDVLIPRPETEKLMEWVCENYQHQHACHVVDLGTGSGAIAIALAHEFPKWHITATDISEKALDVAKQNAILNHVTIEFIKTDWFSNLPNHHFDLVISNPPYIAENDSHLADLTFEPASALIANNHGLAMLKEIINGAANHLKPNGVLILEHGFNQQKEVMRLLKEAEYAAIKGHSDGGNPRFVTAQYRKIYPPF